MRPFQSKKIKNLLQIQKKIIQNGYLSHLSLNACGLKKEGGEALIRGDALNTENTVSAKSVEKRKDARIPIQFIQQQTRMTKSDFHPSNLYL